MFLRQSLKRFGFRVKLSDSIFFLLGLSPIVKLIWHEKQIFWSILRGKYCLIHLEIVKRPKNSTIIVFFLAQCVFNYINKGVTMRDILKKVAHSFTLNLIY
jgi:hypothetical protein